MDELIQLVTRLKALRQEHPALAVRASDSAIAAATVALRPAVAAAERAIAQHREEQASNAGLAALPGFVDLSVATAAPTAVFTASAEESDDDPADAVFFAPPAEAVNLHADRDFDTDAADEEDEPVPAAVLEAQVDRAVGREQIATALDAVMRSVADTFLGYTVTEVTDTGATLTAPDDMGIAAGSLPNGTVVFSGTLPDSGATVTLRIAGPVDPDNPPLDPVAVTNDALAALAADGEPVPEVEELRVIMERQDEAELTFEQADTIVPTAIRALSTLLGAHELIRVEDGEHHAQKVALLRAAGDGQLDRRALALRVAQFDGILPFPGIGRVRAYATV